MDEQAAASIKLLKKMNYSTVFLWCSTFKAYEYDDFIPILLNALDIFDLRQSDLADWLEVGPATISRWLNGKTKPMPRTREAIVAEIGRKAQALYDAAEEE